MGARVSQGPGRLNAMTTARFLTSLRALTVSPDFSDRLRPTGYLVPPDYLTRSGADVTGRLRGRGTFVLVDNGRYDDVGRLVARYQAQAASVLTRIDAEPVLPAARAAAAVLFDEVGAAAADTQPSITLQEQLALNPTAVIGVEDIVPAVWLRLGLDLRLHRQGRADLRRRNQAVADRAAQVVPTTPTARYLSVASAMDYDTARDAGRIFAAAGLPGAAVGFGAYMADDSYVGRYKRDGRWRPLPARMPQRYLRTVLVARGFWDGWADETGGAPEHFHFLGLGAPIMFGLVSMIAAATPQLTFDATSPIRDAVEGTLYVCDPACLKIRTRRVAERLVSGSAQRWACRCPFCRSFLREHPFDYAAGRTWGRQHAGEAVGAAQLRPGGELCTAFPLLSEPKGGALRRAVDRARIGHNHWVLQRVIDAINDHGQTASGMAEHVGEVVEAYGRATNAPGFAAAIRFAYGLAHAA